MHYLLTLTFVDLFCCIRNFLGQGVGPAQWPDANRYMEGLIVHLCDAFPTHKRGKGSLTLRWNLVQGCYQKIKRKVMTNARVLAETGLQLADINQRTLSAW